ncbi:hypothetical protein GOP47_0008038 [Adiantum capillus-veneris]|uniref:Uncharacterized protein n=1 Tax=Adiantum capillus-veneris TaxID=13818 RepID=A0A9D4UXS8_ADICA|nr:hypothetical protein GOP47_0008038 [Adiantum capillus-veneris]
MERKIEERSDRKSHKRKHGDGDAASTDGHRSSKRQISDDGHRGPSRSDVRGHVDILNSCVSSSKSDRAAARRAARALGELAMQAENSGLLVEEGSIVALVKHLKAPRSKGSDGFVPYEYEVEKEAAFVIGLLASKPEYQKLLIEAGSLRPLVALLQTKANDSNERVVNGAIRRAAEAIGCLARDSRSLRTRLRNEGVVALFEVLLESPDRRVQQAASDALQIIGSKTEEKKTESYERNGAKVVAADSNEHLSNQGAKNVSTAEMAAQGNTASQSEDQNSNFKGWSLTPEALSKAKLTLEKQKMLAEKLKKIPKAIQATAQISKASSSSAVLTPSTHVRSTAQTLPANSAIGTISATTNNLPNFPGLVPGVAPLNDALKKVQEVAARLGISQPTDSFFSMMQGNDFGTVGQQRDVRRPVLRLDAQGREIDEHGNVVERTKISNLSTLKVNINKHKKESFQILPPELEEDQTENKFFDPDMGLDKKKLLRQKRPSFQFVVEGSLAKQAEISRMKSRYGEAQAKEIRLKQAALAKAKSEADINPNLIEVSERLPVKEKPRDPIPDVEWWDAVILPSGNYPDSFEGELNVKMEKLTIYVEHPVPIEPPAEPAPPPPQPLKLTKKERKKMRTQRRLAKEKEKQDLIRQGLMEPPKPKVKMSNLMKVLAAEATQDPTKLEMEIRSAAAEREQAHTDRNLARKLTPAERRKKKERKLFDDPNTLETIVSVYKVNDLSHPQTRFKVDVNANENRLTGCIVMCDTMTVVIVEGGSKAIKRYGKLMLQRIKWAAAVKESDETVGEMNSQQVNKCVLVWQGSVARPNFEKFTVQQFRTEAAARKFLSDAKVGHYWELTSNFIEE